MDALAAGHDAAVQMIDTSVVRVHQHGASIAGNTEEDMGRSRGGLTTPWTSPPLTESTPGSLRRLHMKSASK
jgi:hypothetical protein